LDVHQPRISDLLHVDLFSTDTLVEWLDKLGKKVELTLKNKAVA
jgi:predicted XRE-type DNA-binding protein